MKKRIRKTGEIVDVITFSAISTTDRCNEDYVGYIDSKGVEHHCERDLNIYWDFEDVEEVLNTDIDWEQVRIDTAIKICNSLISNVGDSVFRSDITNKDLAKACVNLSDALITELKKRGDK